MGSAPRASAARATARRRASSGVDPQGGSPLPPSCSAPGRPPPTCWRTSCRRAGPGHRDRGLRRAGSTGRARPDRQRPGDGAAARRRAADRRCGAGPDLRGMWAAGVTAAGLVLACASACPASWMRRWTCTASLRPWCSADAGPADRHRGALRRPARPRATAGWRRRTSRRHRPAAGRGHRGGARRQRHADPPGGGRGGVRAGATVLLCGLHRPVRWLPAGPPPWRELLGAGAVTAGVLVLTNVDLLMARALLEPAAAGAYAVGSLFAKAAFWAPNFIAVLVFPRLARDGTSGGRWSPQAPSPSASAARGRPDGSRRASAHRGHLRRGVSRPPDVRRGLRGPRCALRARAAAAAVVGRRHRPPGRGTGVGRHCARGRRDGGVSTARVRSCSWSPRTVNCSWWQSGLSSAGRTSRRPPRDRAGRRTARAPPARARRRLRASPSWRCCCTTARSTRSGRVPRRRRLLRAQRLSSSPACCSSEWLATGRVDLIGFWLRRARRLLPALLLVVVAVAVLRGVVAGPATSSRDPRRLARDARLRRELALHRLGPVVLRAVRAPVPLRHMWSLAIEEQFYLRVAACCSAWCCSPWRRRWSAALSSRRRRRRLGHADGRPLQPGRRTRRASTTAPTPGPRAAARRRGRRPAPVHGTCGAARVVAGLATRSADRAARRPGPGARRHARPLPGRLPAVAAASARGHRGGRRQGGTGALAPVPAAGGGDRPRLLRPLPVALAGLRLARPEPHRPGRRAAAGAPAVRHGGRGGAVLPTSSSSPCGRGHWAASTSALGLAAVAGALVAALVAVLAVGAGAPAVSATSAGSTDAPVAVIGRQLAVGLPRRRLGAVRAARGFPADLAPRPHGLGQHRARLRPGPGAARRGGRPAIAAAGLPRVEPTVAVRAGVGSARPSPWSSSGVGEQFDHLVDGRTVTFGTPEYAAHLHAVLDDYVQKAGGSPEHPVLLVNVPCHGVPIDPDRGRRHDHQRRHAGPVGSTPWSPTTRRAPRAGPASSTCTDSCAPTGTRTPATASRLRTDGLHFTDAGARLVWQWIGDRLAEVAPVGRHRRHLVTAPFGPSSWATRSRTACTAGTSTVSYPVSRSPGAPSWDADCCPTCWWPTASGSPPSRNAPPGRTGGAPRSRGCTRTCRCSWSAAGSSTTDSSTATGSRWGRRPSRRTSGAVSRNTGRAVGVVRLGRGGHRAVPPDARLRSRSRAGCRE